MGLGNATRPIFSVTVEIWATEKIQLGVECAIETLSEGYSWIT
jgi:hypothetical protein